MTSALLVMDLRNGIDDRYGDSGELLSRLEGAVRAAGVAGTPVIFVRVAFRAGAPEVSAEVTTVDTWVAGR